MPCYVSYEITPDMASDMTFNRTYIYIFFLGGCSISFLVSGNVVTLNLEAIFLSVKRLPVGVLHGVYLLRLTSLFGLCFLCAQCSQCDPVGDNLANNTLGLPLSKIMNSS